MSTNPGRGFERGQIDNSQGAAGSDAATENLLADATSTASLNDYRNRLETASTSPTPNQLGFGTFSLEENGKACAT